MKNIIVIGLCAASMGCQRDRFFVEPPPLQSSTAAVLVRASAGGDEVVSAFAFGPEQGFRVNLDDLDTSGGLSLLVLGYQQNLEELGLVQGDVSAGASMAPCARLSPTEVWASTLTSAAADDWGTTTIPNSMTKYLGSPSSCQVADRCFDFGTPQVVTYESGFPRVFEVQADGSFLVGTSRNGFFDLSPDGLTTIRPELADIRPVVSTREDDGRIWVGGLAGKIWILETDGGRNTNDIDTPLSVVGLGISKSGDRRLAAVSDALVSGAQAPFALEFFLQEGSDDWRSIHTSSVSVSETRGMDVVWLDEQQAFASYGGGDLLRLRGDTIDVDTRLPQVEALGFHSELKVLAATLPGDVLSWTAAGWVTVENAKLDVHIKAFLELDDGLAVGNVTPLFRHVVPGAAPCEVFGAASSRIMKMRLSGDVIGLTGSPALSGQQPSVTLMRIRQ